MKTRWPWPTMMVVTAIASGVIPACMTTEQMAPPVDERLKAIGRQRGVESAVLEKGQADVPGGLRPLPHH